MFRKLLFRLGLLIVNATPVINRKLSKIGWGLLARNTPDVETLKNFTTGYFRSLGVEVAVMSQDEYAAARMDYDPEDAHGFLSDGPPPKTWSN